LTTYETLRDFEFSFAEEDWSIMVCDEAQKIKNPNTLMTRSAKKQKVRFKIACTGTPVENTLADLWCLFDFVQPGLLGALNDFGRRYRRQDEAGTPYCITVDTQTLSDRTVTIRDRDTLEQVRIKIDDVVSEVESRVTGV
jgi:SNF2 family DNA or RNA helicase